MNNETVLIEKYETPIIMVNGVKFELLCEFESTMPNSRFQGVYREDRGNDVLITVNENTAISGLFSVEKGKLKQLFDYIESKITKKDGLVCYESESFPRFLQLAAEAGGRYPKLQKEVDPQKGSILSGLFGKLRPARVLDRTLQEQILSHTVQVEYCKPKSYRSISGAYLPGDAQNGSDTMEIVGSAKIDNHSSMYSVELKPGFLVDVKVRTDTGLIYVLENEDGSCVYDQDSVDYTFPDYDFDEAAVVQFVRDTLSKPTLSEKIACAEASQRVLQASESQITSYIGLTSEECDSIPF